jgi:LPPG:FO 2-phospho-L-lactate transferase
MISVIAGGVGAARYLKALLEVVPGDQITAIVNTGDDTVFHGLHISPDIDTVVYTTSGAIDAERGWGLGGESWTAMESLARYAPYGAPDWFNLGDRDLATHLWRTGQLRLGRSLTDITADLALAWGLTIKVLPMTNDPVSTFVKTVEPLTETGELAFQEYFVKHRHGVAVSSVRFAGIESCTPGAEVLSTIASASRIVIAPSNPIVSIGPVLDVPGVRDALIARRADVVAISPIIAGAALKGPADRLLTELGHESTALGIARLYAPFTGTLVIDTLDAELAPAIEALGLRCIVTDTIMSQPGVSASLAAATLATL